MANSIRILSVGGNPIKAITKIPYKGYEISISTCPRLPEIAIYDGDNNLQGDFMPYCDTDNLIEAFKFIDAKVA